MISKLSPLFFFLIILSGSPSAQASCETEIATRDRYDSWCRGSTTASGIAFLAGTLALPPFGGLLGAVNAHDAHVACSKRDEWKQAVEACHELEARMASHQAERDADYRKILGDYQLYLEIYARWEQSKIEISARHRTEMERKLQLVADELKSNGMDLESDLAREQMQSEIRSLKAARDKELKDADDSASREVQEHGLIYLVAAMLMD